MAEQTIDKLQIVIEAEAEKGSEGIKKFIDAIEKIKRLTSDGVSGLSAVRDQFSKLSEAIKPLEDKVKPLGDMARNLKKLNNLDVSQLASQLSDISKAIEKFNASASIGNISGISISKNLSGINDIDFLKAEAKMKRLQASVARADVSIERSRQNMEKLAQANEIAAAKARLEETQIKALNSAMQESIQETKALKDASEEVKGTMGTSNYMDPARISESARQYRELQKAMGNISPEVDRLNDAFAELANNAGIKLNELDSHIELQKRALSGLRESLANAVSNFGADSPQALGIEEKILNAERAIQSMTEKTNSLFSALQSAEYAAGGMNQRFKEMNADTASVENITGDLGQRLKDLKAEYSSVGKIGKIVMDTASGSTGKASKSAMGLGRELEEVKDVFRSIGPAARSGMGEVSSAVNRTVRDTDKAAKSLRKLKTETKVKSGTGGLLSGILGMGKGLKRILSVTAITYAVKKATDAIGNFVTKTNDYIENVNLFSVSMGRFASEAEEYASKFQTKLGFDSGEAMRYMGVIQQLATSFGMTGERALTLSKNITGLSYDFASFYNLKPEESFAKLRSAISGEIEPVRQLGIDLSTARLQQELYTLGIDRSVSSLNQADKATLRYIALMKQVGKVSGDAARTINSPANALRVLQAQLQVTARAIGSIFIPALNAIIPYVTAVVKVIGMGASALASFFGFKMPEIVSPDLGSNLGGSLGDASEGLDEVADSAEKAQKEVRQLIGGFDELNILSKNESQELDDLKGMGNLLGGIDLPSYDPFEGLEDSRVDEIVDKIIDALKRLRDTLMDLGLQDVIEKFKSVWNTLYEEIGKYDFGERIKSIFLHGFELAMVAIMAALTLFEPMIEGTVALVYELLGVLDSFFAQLAVNINELLPQFEQLGTILGEFLLTFAEQISNYDIGGAFADMLGAGLSAALSILIASGETVLPLTVALDIPGIIYEGLRTIETLFSAVDKAVKSVTPGLKQFVEIGLAPIAEWVGGKIQEELQFLQEQLTKIGDWFTEHTTLFSEFGETMGELVAIIWEVIEPIADPIWEGFKSILDKIVNVVLSLIENFIAWEIHIADSVIEVYNFLDSLGIIEPIANFFKQQIDGICQAIGGILTIFQGVLDFLTGIFLGDWEKVWEGTKEIFQGAWDVIDGIITMFFGDWKEKISNWWNNDVKPWFSLFQTNLEDLKKSFVKKWDEISEKTKTTFDILKEKASTSLQSLLENSEEKISEIESKWSEGWKSIKDIVVDKIGQIRTKSSVAFNDLKQISFEFISQFKSNWSNGWNSVKSISSSAFSGIKSMASNAFNSIMSTVLNLISKIKSAISSIKELLSWQNKTKSVGTVTPKSSSRYSSYSDYSIRPAPVALAGGGVISEPTYALVGEYQGARSDPEIVAPQSTIEASVVAANGQLVQAMYQMTQMMVAAFSQGQSVSVQIDGREIGKASAEYMREEERRTGKNPGRL